MRDYEKALEKTLPAVANQNFIPELQKEGEKEGKNS